MALVTTLPETASQTAGPYVHIGLAPFAADIDLPYAGDWWVLAGEGARGQHIRLEGRVIDGQGEVVRDGLIEIWQADADGRHHHPDDPGRRDADPAFRGFGRAVASRETGRWAFETVKPGRVADRRGRRMAPHINLALFARGINLHLVTRIYFADEAAANAEDPVLRLVQPAFRRETLLARPETRDGRTVYLFDVRLQGENETVFLDV